MNKIKRTLSAVLATAMIATMFAGCGKEKPEDTFKTAMENSVNMESYKMTGDMVVSKLQDAPKTKDAENISNTAVMPALSIEMEATAMDKGLTNATKITTSILGMGTMEQSVYMKDNATYTSMDDNKTFIKTSLEESTGMELSNLQKLSKKYNAQLLEKIVGADIKFEETEDGLSAEFAVTKDMYVDIIKDVMAEMYPDGSMEEQIRTETTNNLLAMGLTEEDIASEKIQEQINSSVKSATTMLNSIMDNLNFNKFDVKCLIKDEQIVSMSYDMELDLKPIMESMAEIAPEMAETIPEDMRIGIKIDVEMSEINAITSIDMPEFTEENTITMDEYISSSMDETLEGMNELPETATEEVVETPAEEVPAA